MADFNSGPHIISFRYDAGSLDTAPFPRLIEQFCQSDGMRNVYGKHNRRAIFCRLLHIGFDDQAIARTTFCNLLGNFVRQLIKMLDTLPRLQPQMRTIFFIGMIGFKTR